MSASDSTQWFWSDWRGDHLVRRLTPAERGLWIDLLSYAAASTPVGYICDQQGSPISYEEIARFTNATPTEVATLIDGILAKGVASRDRTGRLFNRRMTRQAEKTAKKRLAGKLGAEQTKQVWKGLRSLAEKQSALAHATADAVAPSTRPIQSNKIISTVSVERGGFGKGEYIGTPEFQQLLRSKLT